MALRVVICNHLPSLLRPRISGCRASLVRHAARRHPRQEDVTHRAARSQPLFVVSEPLTFPFQPGAFGFSLLCPMPADWPAATVGSQAEIISSLGSLGRWDPKVLGIVVGSLLTALVIAAVIKKKAIGVTGPQAAHTREDGRAALTADQGRPPNERFRGSCAGSSHFS